MMLPDLLARKFKDARILAVASSNPAANTEISHTVPSGKLWVPLSVTVQMVQGATQTPQPALQLDDGTNVLFEQFGATAAQSASTTARYTWSGSGQPTALIGATPNIRATAPLPPIPLLSGYRIRTITPGLGANSDYGAAQMLVAEYDL